MNKTFSEAAQSYIDNVGNNKYLPPIIEYFKEKRLEEIYPFDVRKMATDLYSDHKNSTLNRQAITPARAVIMHGYERGWCNLIRIRKFKED
jgi:hypothetical protein